MSTFKVISSNPNQKGGFVTKLQQEVIVKDSIFGDKSKKTTYYISGSKQLEIDMEIGESHIFPKYRIEEHEMLNTETNDKFMGKWLHLA